ncbi:methyltransferase type 11 [Nocardia sp. 852002-20019_SCH5090214]|uniref:class I SAM-dependent methyltransferase n=1 Tax=Nocardia sp. 852002-20019_SCH5090214 TaxID=1834087 RepID=UPI0007EAE458|nr:class I SAM-dependent methyltransferase [Nocardia sp. 852002-20019_SCH5090214]OBA48691.1 methyltransferase type 11 [Nocardia sp. 852002-20019_SCH5090214]
MTQSHPSTDQAIESNRALWDEWAKIHAEGDWYDLAAVRAGADKLRPYEIEEVGDVAGKSLLHLQCQIGTDSIAWARRGAAVTAVDFSPVAIGVATQLAQDAGVDAQFVVSDVMRLPENLTGTWDIVYASRGILGWLPDLTAWAEVVAHFLAPGGIFYLTDIHPVAKAVDDHSPEFRVGRPYWSRSEPIRHEVRGTYADPDADVESTDKFLWAHSTGELLTSIAQAGLCLEFFHEFPWLDRPWPSLLKQSDREYLPPNGIELPLTFSLRARKF